jgi:hypothetical protein
MNNPCVNFTWLIIIYVIHYKCMFKIQIYLPEYLRQEIDAVARSEKIPASKVIREILIDGISKRNKETAGAALNKLTAFKVKGGPKDLSINLDKYLYE